MDRIHGIFAVRLANESGIDPDLVTKAFSHIFKGLVALLNFRLEENDHPSIGDDDASIIPHSSISSTEHQICQKVSHQFQLRF